MPITEDPNPFYAGYNAHKAAKAEIANMEMDAAYKGGLLEMYKQKAAAEAAAAPFKQMQALQKYQLNNQALEKGRLEQLRSDAELISQRLAPAVMAHKRGTLDAHGLLNYAGNLGKELGLPAEQIQSILASGPQGLEMIVQQARDVENQLKPPPAPPPPQLFYNGPTAVQKQWNPTTQNYDVVGHRPTFSPNSGGRDKETKSDVVLGIARRMGDRTATEQDATLFYQLTGRDLSEAASLRAQEAQLRADWNAEYPLNSITGERPEGAPTLREYKDQRIREMAGDDAPKDEGPPTLQTQAEYDALPSGATFRDPGDGKLYKKP